MFFENKAPDRSAEIAEILDAAAQLADLPPYDLRRRFQSNEDAHEALACAVAAARRALGFTLFPEQVWCAFALLDNRIVEMQTGEGKTLAAVPAAALRAKSGPVHILTANDYLARRDAQWMGPIYESLGLTVSSISQSTHTPGRRQAYQADITYLAATEAGFDHLRDCRALTPEERVQRDLHALIVDEADSVLIDEARIPLVLAGEHPGEEDRALRAGPVARALIHGLHYFVHHDRQHIEITYTGLDASEALLRQGSLYDEENTPWSTAIYHALHAHHFLARNRDYLVRHNRIIPIDEYKGRLALERQWPAGIHAALEEKEGVPVRGSGRVLASITLQNYVLQYEHTAGMTGTAETQKDEFREIYQMEVEVLPTHRPVIRIDHEDALFRTTHEKLAALCAEVREMHSESRPVLIGTGSVEASEALSQLLPDIPHVVLNAANEEAEAELIAKAGLPGAVTISTNMAGRGVDIQLGDGVAERGGLHVIGALRHESRRIDRQLRGRAGRQGDPGSSRFFVSLEDELFLKFREPGERITAEELQRRVEGMHLAARKFLHKYESVLEGQRHAFLQKREELFPDLENKRQLEAMDEAWARYLEEVAILRSNFVFLQMGGRDPLSEYLRNVHQLFENLWDEVDRLLDSGDLPTRRGAVWTYVTVDQPLGTPMERLMRGLSRKFRSGSLWG
jgi:preprotein translocase subunit SecA